MSVIYILIPLAIVIIAIAIAAFMWAVKSDQFNDLERQGYSILFDDDVKQTPKKPPQEASEESAVKSEDTPN
jgi:cbb3-type cytochrome oxidase maturation protein